MQPRLFSNMLKIKTYFLHETMRVKNKLVPCLGLHPAVANEFILCYVNVKGKVIKPGISVTLSLATKLHLFNARTV